MKSAIVNYHVNFVEDLSEDKICNNVIFKADMFKSHDNWLCTLLYF